MQSVAISSKTLQSCFFNSHKFLSAYISVSINSGPGLGNKGKVSSLIGLPCLRSVLDLGKVICALYAMP